MENASKQITELRDRVALLNPVEFKEMLSEYKIPETPSSPYNHASNGLAERHVGVAKLLLKKCLASKQDFRSALATLNATARHDGYSP